MNTKGSKIFVVLDCFGLGLRGCFTTKSKAKEFIDRLESEDDLQIEEEYLDDFSIFGPIDEEKSNDSR